MITTSSSITVQKVLRAGTVTNYVADKISLFIKSNGIQKRFNATSVVNSTLATNGTVTFSGVTLWGDGSYSLYITAEDVSDIDVNGVAFNKLATGYIKKITNVDTLVV